MIIDINFFNQTHSFFKDVSKEFLLPNLGNLEKDQISEKSDEIKHVCTISKDNVQLSYDEHIPVNNDVLVLLVEAKNSHILEKYINDY